MKKTLFLFLMAFFLLAPLSSGQLISGIETYLGFDENSGLTAFDDLNNHNATLSNVNIWTTNSFLGAAATSYLGSNSYYVDLDGVSKSAGTGDFTMNFWINANSPGSTAQNARLFHSGAGTTFSNVFEIRQHALKIYVGTSYGVNLNSGGVDIPLNDWVMVTTTREGTNMSLFINGNLDKTETASGWGFDMNAANVAILGKLYTTGTSGSFNGSIDEFAFWNSRALSEEEIQELYNSGNGLPYPFDPQEPGVYITAFDFFNGNATSNLNVTLSNGTIFQNATGNKIYMNLSNGAYTYTVSSTGFVSQTHTIAHENITVETYNLVSTTSTPLVMRIFNSNTGEFITQQVDITVQSDTNQYTNSTSTGNITFQPIFNIGDSYTIILNSTGAINFSQTTYDIVYNQNLAIDGIDMYMTPFVLDGEFITFVAQRPDLTLIQNALVTVEKFINGTYQTIGQKNTDILGEADFFLEPGKTHKVTVRADGFVTQTFITTLLQTVYSVVLPFESDFDFSQGFEGVTFSHQPTKTVLRPTTNTFNFTVNAINQNLQYMQIFLRDSSGNVIAQQFSNSQSGTTLSITQNLSAYNGSYVVFDRRFKITGYDEQRFVTNYNVNDLEKFEGTIQELREYLITNPDVSLTLRITIFAVFFIITMIVLATFITGLTNVLLSLSVGLIIAYMVGLNIYIVAVIMTVLFLFLLGVNLREAGA
jgi:hypothetical protein